MTRGALKAEPVAQCSSSTAIFSLYHIVSRHVAARQLEGKKKWHVDLGEEITMGLVLFQDPDSFVYPAAITAYDAPPRQKNVNLGIGQA